MNRAPCIWLPRPEADSVAMAEALARQHIASCIAPLMRVERLPVEPVSFTPDALLITSRHALHGLQHAWKDLPVFCVGEATAQAVRERGFARAYAGPGDLLSLIPDITAGLQPEAHVLYLSGEDIQLDPAPLLALHHITCTRQIVYTAVAEATLPSTLRLKLEQGEITSIALFSRRMAELACRLLKEEQLADAAPNIDAYCLSLNIAEAAGALPWKSVKASHLPTSAAFFAMLVAAVRPIAS